MSAFEEALSEAIDGGDAPASERLARLLDAEWAYDVTEFPELGYAVGEAEPGAGWTDRSLEAVERRRRQSELRYRAAQSIDGAGLAGDEALNHRLFLRAARLDAEGVRFPDHLTPVGKLDGPQQEVPLSIADMPFQNAADYDALVARLELVPALINQVIAAMEEGAATGIVPPRVTVEGAPDQIRALVTAEPLESGLAQPFAHLPPGIGTVGAARLRTAMARVLSDAVLPAFAKLGSFVEESYLGACRETIALSELPDGPDWYAWRIRGHTSTDLDAETIHQLGLDELDRIAGETEEVMARAGYAGRRGEFLHHVHHDPRFVPASADALVAAYRALCKRVDPELPKLFATLPWLPYGVQPMPAHIEQTAPAAYYLPGSTTARRPGYFMANTFALEQRPNWEMVPLALHEAVPGHHLQFAVAQQLDHLHPWRRHLNETAYVEGWGLYAESLGHDMGLYDDPFDHFGALVFEAWRACRLVVDTGMHAMGWTRRQAVDFMGERTGKPGHDVEVEVDRYIAWPGQALAYTLGMVRMRGLRAAATAALGDAFDIRTFHDELLGHGPLPLDVLEEVVTAWVAAGSAE